MQKIFELLGGKSMTPGQESLRFLPTTPLSPLRILKGLFELTKRPSRALNSPRALHSKLLGPKREVLNGLRVVNQILEVPKLEQTPRTHLAPIWPNKIDFGNPQG